MLKVQAGYMKSYKILKTVDDDSTTGTCLFSANTQAWRIWKRMKRRQMPNRERYGEAINQDDERL
jgi:hypothetical protein